MNKTVSILSISVAAAAAAFLSGCSSVDMGPATVVDHSTYSDGAATAPVQTPSLLPGGIVDSGRTHTVAVGDTIYNISVRYGLSAEQLQQPVKIRFHVFPPRLEAPGSSRMHTLRFFFSDFSLYAH